MPTLVVLIGAGMFVTYHNNKSVGIQLGQMVIASSAKLMRMKITICHTSGKTH